MRVYVDLLRYGAARRLTAATATGKLGFAVFPLATVLLGHGSSGSFLDAGAVAGAWGMGGTVTGPLRGRLVDRYGQRLPLVALTLITALAAAGLATAAGTTQLICFGALTGAAAPPIVASIRPLWAQAAPKDLVHSAYALDAVLTEVTKICGPLVAAASAVHSPRLGVITAAALLTASTCLVISHPPTRRPPAASRTGGVPASPALRLLLAANACAGLFLGALTVGLPARAAESGSVADSGWLFACLALGSALVGARFGTRRRAASPATGYLTTFAWLALSLALLAAVSTPLPLVILLLSTGAALAPMTICLFELLDVHASQHTAVASMMWMVAGEELGVAAGSVVAGLLAQNVGAWLALLAAAASAGLGALVVATGRVALASDSTATDHGCPVSNDRG
ncbi:MFS transporter [Streptomyces ureilyticus]|uniref:MFS transporter n=1 Tax=Streptomyces ureilyticus TaxID=1775131 RepID=A0ABX0DV74_9ACTN|nr:MFS transporter [Streptomyces ureilyticus]NGO42977.1 MFS transporter [Streptomyces ureilyticus]